MFQREGKSWPRVKQVSTRKCANARVKGTKQKGGENRKDQRNNDPSENHFSFITIDSCRRTNRFLGLSLYGSSVLVVTIFCEFCARRTAHELPQIIYRWGLSDPLSKNTKYVAAESEKPTRYFCLTSGARRPALQEEDVKRKKGIKGASL